MEKVRVRFAPSPTGPLHIGGVRTALYNYLYARQQGGDFILRIEDTDRSRFVAGAEEYIQKSLEWCGIEISEGPVQGGEYAPYRQSERKELYNKYVQKLLDEGNAYYAFDTPEELIEMRERLKAARVASPQYNSITRVQMKNSLTLPQNEVESRLANNEPYVIRLKVPRKEEVRLNDAVRGWVMVHSSAIDDKVLMKSDGMPTYHLANVVDDHLMKITHVIRGEEWLPSAPLHVLLYRFFGWEKEMPKFAHLPLILKPDGNGKLSKRDGDKLGFPVFPLEWKDPKTGEVSSGFREQGYLPEAMVNFLAMLGWNPGTNQELFSMDDLVKEFSLERIGKAGTKFDIDKAKWFNQEYLRKRSNDNLAEVIIAEAAKENLQVDPNKAREVAGLMKERANFPSELWQQGRYFFIPPHTYDTTVHSKKWGEDPKKVIQSLVKRLDELASFSGDNIKALINEICIELDIKLGKVMPGLRLAITGGGTGPELMRIMEILGKSETKKRLEKALSEL